MDEYLDYITTLRRAFHRRPEIGFDVGGTLEVIAGELTKSGFLVAREKTGIIGIKNNGVGKVIAIRSDVDALPIPDRTCGGYASEIPDRNHACGHDAHMAMLLGLCRYCRDHPEAFTGTLKVIFQAAEEGPLPGGGISLAESPLLTDVAAYFALHVMGNQPYGCFISRPGAFMAADDNPSIKISGVSTHVATPELGRNPLDVLPELLAKIKELEQESKQLIGVTKIIGGTTFNVIPDNCLVCGSIRSFDEQKRQKIRSRLGEIGATLSKKYGVNIDVDIAVGYPPVINDEQLFELVKTLVTENFAPGTFIEAKKPFMMAEDFAYYQRKAPGIMVYLGVNQPEKGFIHSNHHPAFDLDERVLLHGLKFYILLLSALMR